MSTRRLASLLLVEMTSPSVRMTMSSTSILISDKALSRIAKSLMLDMTELVGRFDLAEKGLVSWKLHFFGHRKLIQYSPYPRLTEKAVSTSTTSRSLSPSSPG